MIFTFWLTIVLVSSTAIAMPLKHTRSSNDDADETIGNVWTLSSSSHGEDLGIVEEKRSSDNDADEMIGNVWTLSSSNHGEDLGPINTE
ncbi:hypothetical protein K504DRAFT_532032 [Pleomassaria siparia CBS 279.74]|uniref:Uncharacterized protein n=1 Tax=Pleomassaria siparia CBS 279.74 TaxID=1314801 RepID=A0A6G1KFW9_9PLEO|nr:hypothetical protein K504DRAFT_532032 [Pleomassaria siparia CBS 279.74]